MTTTGDNVIQFINSLDFSQLRSVMRRREGDENRNDYAMGTYTGIVPGTNIIFETSSEDLRSVHFIFPDSPTEKGIRMHLDRAMDDHIGMNVNSYENGEHQYLSMYAARDATGAYVLNSAHLRHSRNGDIVDISERYRDGKVAGTILQDFGSDGPTDAAYATSANYWEWDGPTFASNHNGVRAEVPLEQVSADIERHTSTHIDIDNLGELPSQARSALNLPTPSARITFDKQ
ncbi:MAG: hypothetical protein ACOYJ2_08055 [Rickettsiales bacterium]